MNTITDKDVDDLIDIGFRCQPEKYGPYDLIIFDDNLNVAVGDYVTWSVIGALLGVLAELEVDFQYERVKAPGKIMYVATGEGAPYVNIFSNATKAEIFRKLIEIIKQKRNR